MEKGLTIKAIIQDQKDIKALASAGADMNTSQDRHLTASQLSTASLAVETEVRHLLSGLPHSLMPSHSTSEDPGAPSLLQETVDLTPRLVTITFRHLLGGGTQGGSTWTSVDGLRAKAAMEEIRWLLKNTVISVLAPYGDVPVHKIVFITSALARDVVKAVFDRFEVQSSTFCLLNDSYNLHSLEATRKLVDEVARGNKVIVFSVCSL